MVVSYRVINLIMSVCVAYLLVICSINSCEFVIIVIDCVIDLIMSVGVAYLLVIRSIDGCESLSCYRCHQLCYHRI